MENSFYIILKVFFLSRYLNFCLNFLVIQNKWLDQKLMVDFNVLIALNLAYNRNKLYKTLEYRSRDMLNFDFFQKESGNSFATSFFNMIFQKKCLSCCVLLTDKILVPDNFYFLRFWAICTLQLFLFQIVTSQILKLTLPF